ncbi:MAG: gliding motility-associated C-terminal domain-containing protein [Bacteroidia bacterium]
MTISKEMKSLGVMLSLYLGIGMSFSFAQGPQDCINAITVCTNVYQQTTSFNGFGVQEVNSSTTCLSNGENNSSWYIFSIQTGGSLLIQIDPVNQQDDYDFILYDITNLTCADIANGTANVVSCNFSSTPGSTGISASGTSNSQPSGGSNQNALLTVSSGQTFALMVDNFTSTTTGYTLTFSGTAAILDTDAPAMTNASINSCQADTITIQFTENINCSSISPNGSDFSITGPSSVSVSSAYGIGCNVNSTASAIVLVVSPLTAAGTYTINVKNGIDGNTVSDFCGNFIDVGSTLTFNVPFVGPKVTIPFFASDTCSNGVGAAHSSVTGGTPPLSYFWNSSPPQTTPNASNLPVGNYTITVSDANGCTSTAQVFIIDSGSPALSVQKKDETCDSLNNGEATIIPGGGTGPFTYSWNTVPPQFTQTATGLTSGSYTCIVTGANGCTSTAVVHIGLSGKPSIQVGYTNVSCDSSVLGSASANASGFDPFTYQWSTSPPQTSQTISGLQQGTYVVTVTDIYGCTSEAIVAIGIGSINIFSSTTNASCGNAPDGTATLTVSDGIPPYSYAWSTNPVQTTATATGLLPGTYNVTVTDSVGCEETHSVTIVGPPSMVLNMATVKSSCITPDGSATVSVSGGNPPYTYSWNTTPVQTGATANNLAAGIYEVTVTDNIGCTMVMSAFISNYDGPDGYIGSVTDATCKQPNGSATVVLNTGNPPITYEWSTTPAQNGATGINMPEGTYYVKITDVNGCLMFLNVKINEIEMVTLLFDSATKANCGYSNAIAMVTDTGGIGPITIDWLVSPPQFGNVATNLPGGTFLAIATDANGCKDTVEVIIEEEKANNSIEYNSACIDEPASFQGVTDYPGMLNWSWDFGDPASGPDNYDTGQITSHTYYQTGFYEVMLFIDGGCATDTIKITISPALLPEASFTIEPEEIFANSAVLFLYTGTEVEKFNWSTSTNLISYDINPIFTFYNVHDSVTVNLIVTNIHGCIDSVSKSFYIDDAPAFWVPNGFTPDGDGLNDSFKVYAHGLKECDVKIYSRWGDLIFQSDDIDYLKTTGWDGSIQGNEPRQDIYVYRIEGRLYDGKPFTRKGYVTIVK